ncbi:MAG TPA: heme o synthase [Candidatus Limnocylindrales bacterium]|nr:heme o synthase [Candidatus Limnocylindrales bacterium]
MSRFTRLALLAAMTTYLLVVIGAIVRGTGSGMGCPDWPTCYGAWIPPLGDTAAWIEWIHRSVAAIVGLLVLAVAVVALRRKRHSRAIVGVSLGALALTGFQAWLGKITVETNNAGEWVTAHLAAAMILLAMLAFIAVRSHYDRPQPERGGNQRLTLLLAFTAGSVFALLLFGAHVTAIGAGLIFRDWPLFNGQLIPGWSDNPTFAAMEMSHFLHRFVAAVVGVIVALAAWASWRAARHGLPGGQPLLVLVGSAAALYVMQIFVGAAQIWTTLAPWAVALHLAIGAAIWVLLAAAAFVGFFEARLADSRSDVGPAHGSPDPAVPGPSLRDRVGAYVALTKPRIIELLLVTTVPAMILAARGLPPLDLVAWVLIGGTLAAGAANAINCYFDRDIDEVMSRTRRRPLPAHSIQPESALVFGLVLAVVAFGVMVWFTNLVAAFLTLVAMAFYVVIYTMLLKRSTPQNIVLGGAAGALPPVIGWSAVTGDITLPALLLFAIVFYWTPPHFWALSLRLRRDYEAAAVPMLPVTHGVPETTRQIALYSVLMVALTLVFFAAAQMGLIFLAGAVLLGGVFLVYAFAMWREGTDRRAVRVYRYSITYLTGLFALVVLDVFVYLPL